MQQVSTTHSCTFLFLGNTQRLFHRLCYCSLFKQSKNDRCLQQVTAHISYTAHHDPVQTAHVFTHFIVNPSLESHSKAEGSYSYRDDASASYSKHLYPVLNNSHLRLDYELLEKSLWLLSEYPTQFNVCSAHVSMRSGLCAPAVRNKDKEVPQHDKQSADGGCGFQFWHAKWSNWKLAQRQPQTCLRREGTPLLPSGTKFTWRKPR